jgi:hypothetical protein
MRIRWAGNIASMGKKRNAYRLLVGTPERKRPLGIPTRMRRAIVNTAINLPVP